MNMDTNETELVSKLRLLGASGAAVAPDFDYEGLLERHERRQQRRRRRVAAARTCAAVLVAAMIGVSVWRAERVGEAAPAEARAPELAFESAMFEPERRVVRADTYFALAALEDHIASIDDTLSYARLAGPDAGLASADVARLERTRAELLDSYVRVRYAETVAANF